jgi:hypothetical protein
VKSDGSASLGHYTSGLVLHKGWRPRVGYDPVAQEDVDAMRPRHQQELIAAGNAARRKAQLLSQRNKRKRFKREWAGFTGRAPLLGDGKWKPEDFRHREDGKFSHSEYVRYQAAIKAVIRGTKWRNRLREAEEREAQQQGLSEQALAPAAASR